MTIKINHFAHNIEVSSLLKTDVLYLASCKFCFNEFLVMYGSGKIWNTAQKTARSTHDFYDTESV